MRIINTATAELSSLDTLGQLSLYNGMDVLSLFEINAELDELLTPTKRTTYEFEMELQATLLEMELAGFAVDIPTRNKLIREHEAELAILQAHLHTLCTAIGYYDYYRDIAIHEFAEAVSASPATLPRTWAEWLALPISARRAFKVCNPVACAEYHKALKLYDLPFNGNSPAQKLRLFYHFFGSPANIECEKYKVLPPWNKAHGIPEHKTRNINNEYTPAVDRESLDKISLRAHDLDPRDAHTWAWPFVKCCLEMADITKTLGFLNCRLERGIFRSSFNAATETGRLSSSANAQGYGSNAQNVSPRLRSILTVRPPYKLGAIDYGQIESRCVAARCFVQFGATAYLNATNCGDLHSLAASMVWEDLPWPEDFNLKWLEQHGPFPSDMLRVAKKIASEKFYRGKSRRDVSKTLGHGSSYMGKPPQMSRMSHIDVKLIEHYQAVFFAAFPEIKAWHRWIAEQVQRFGEVTTIMGRTRRFFNRPNDDSTLREAVAFDPQSTAADYTNTALLTLHKLTLAGKLEIQLRAQKHDELIFSFHSDKEALIIPQVISAMEHPIVLTSPTGETRTWYVPTEAEVGWNLGRRSDSNPDGLVGFPDVRTRVNNPFDFFGATL